MHSSTDHETSAAAQSPPIKDCRARLRHPNIPPDAVRLTGILVRILPAGYGFIQTDEREYFISVASMRSREDWKLDQVLSFLPGRGQPDKAPPAYDAYAVPATELPMRG